MNRPCPITADRDAWRGAAVTDADREAAKAYFASMDGDLLDGAFARHRLTSQAELLAHLEWAVEFIRGLAGNVAQVQAIEAAIAKARPDA